MIYVCACFRPCAPRPPAPPTPSTTRRNWSSSPTRRTLARPCTCARPRRARLCSWARTRGGPAQARTAPEACSGPARRRRCSQLARASPSWTSLDLAFPSPSRARFNGALEISKPPRPLRRFLRMRVRLRLALRTLWSLAAPRSESPQPELAAVHTAAGRARREAGAGALSINTSSTVRSLHCGRSALWTGSPGREKAHHELGLAALRPKVAGARDWATVRTPGAARRGHLCGESVPSAACQ